MSQMSNTSKHMYWSKEKYNEFFTNFSYWRYVPKPTDTKPSSDKVKSNFVRFSFILTCALESKILIPSTKKNMGFTQKDFLSEKLKSEP